MFCTKEVVENWLKENHSELCWHRVGGDKPPIRTDSFYLNRSEGYEVRDLMYEFFRNCNIQCNEENLEKVYNEIQNYKEGEKVKREEVLGYLHEIFSC